MTFGEMLNRPLFKTVVKFSELSHENVIGWLEGRWLAEFEDLMSNDLVEVMICTQFVECFMPWFSKEFMRARFILKPDIASMDVPQQGSAWFCLWGPLMGVIPNGIANNILHVAIKDGMVYDPMQDKETPYEIFLREYEARIGSCYVIYVTKRPELH